VVLQNNEIQALNIPVPPSPLLEKAVGFPNLHHARYIGLWWERCGDELICSDGMRTATCYCEGYLAYIRHEKVSIDGAKLGDSENEAKNMLIFDLLEQKAYLAPIRVGEKFLSNQWNWRTGKCKVLSMSDPSVAKRIQEIQEEFEASATFEGLLQGIEESEHQVFLLEEWLDSYQPPQ
jgi:hypothetical protein